MAAKPKPLFWFAVVIVVLALIIFAISRTDHSKKEGATTGDEVQMDPKTQVVINFYSSSAKSDWIDDMVKRFNNSRQRSNGGQIYVKAYHGNSGEQLDEIKAGRIRPDIWSPGDDSWLQMVAASWRDTKQKNLFKTTYPLVNVPLVIAMWEPMAKILGYPKPIGWKDIAAVAANPKGWAAYGHPEWGKFRWGHAHPDSNSGFLTIVSEVYAVLNKTEGISPNDLKKPEVISFLQGFEGAVEHYGLSNSWIDTFMRTKGPSYLSATVQYENTIIQSNEKYGDKPFKLVAIYPKEGYFLNTHPAVIFDEEWVTPEKQEASLKFIDYLLSENAQKRAMEFGIRPIKKEMEMSSPFDEAHGVRIEAESAKAYQVPDEGVLKRIRDLWETVKVPSTVILVLDHSASMRGKPIDNAKIGAVQFLKSMKPRDQLMAVIFNHEITQLSELCRINECGESVINRIDGVFADGETALYDVVAKYYQYLKQLKKQDPNRRYGLLLLSDGQDTASKIDQNDFLDLLPTGEDVDTPKIYTIAYGPEADKELLTQMANKTNARLFSSNPDVILKTYKELSANF